MPESGLSGSVRGVPSNGHPYRDPRSQPAEPTKWLPRPVYPRSRQSADFQQAASNIFSLLVKYGFRQILTNESMIPKS
jgi:hypothetical protein